MHQPNCSSRWQVFLLLWHCVHGLAAGCHSRNPASLHVGNKLFSCQQSLQRKLQFSQLLSKHDLHMLRTCPSCSWRLFTVCQSPWVPPKKTRQQAEIFCRLSMLHGPPGLGYWTYSSLGDWRFPSLSPWFDVVRRTWSLIFCLKKTKLAEIFARIWRVIVFHIARVSFD